MEYQISLLLKLIEEERKELIQLGTRKPFADPEVIKVSQSLDRLLDKYQELQYNLKCGTIWFEWFESDDISHPVQYLIDDDKKVS